MHEWALADAVVSTAIKVAEEQGFAEIMEIKIKLGQLQQIEGEIFEFAMREIMQSQKPLFEKAKIELQVEKAVLKCRGCGQKWAIGDINEELGSEESEAIHCIPEVAHAHIWCPKCKSPDFEILQGRGVRIDSVLGERAD